MKYTFNSMNRIAVKKLNEILLITISLLFYSTVLYGQPTGSTVTGAATKGIPVSVPFLTIAPDGRSTGMGDAGAASTPDVNSQHWNAARYAFAEEKSSVALTYSPWLTNLIPDIWHLYLAGYYKISEKNTISSSFRYFSLGTLTFSGVGTTGQDFHLREFAMDAGYTRKFTDHFSGGLVLRYIQSDPTVSSTTAGGQDPDAGKSIAADLGLYYQNEIHIIGRKAHWALGLHISNMGPPVSYSADAEGLPLPTNLRIGGRLTYHINENNCITFLTDMNKLMVPTPPVYDDSIYAETGELVVSRGKEKPASVVMGMLQSFYDAPGVQQAYNQYSVAREEFHEIAWSLGTEYWYKERLALRTGYFHEHAAKGNRQYFTFGLGVRYRILNCDISYLLPRAGTTSSLFNTFRVSVAIEFV